MTLRGTEIKKTSRFTLEGETQQRIMNQSAVGKKKNPQEILRTFSKHDVCETLSSRQFLERQEAAGISSQKVNTDCWHLLIIFSWANCTSLLPPINVFWWQRARWNNKTARLTAPAKRLTDYSGFYISEQLPPLAKKNKNQGVMGIWQQLH